MTAEEHRAEHVRLHRALDELMGCYLSQRGEPRTSIHDEIFALMKWSFEMTKTAPEISETKSADGGQGPVAPPLKESET